MSVGLIEDVGKSFGYAVDNTLKKILRWIGLTIVMCIPIVNFIAMGLFLKVFRGEEPDFSNAGKSFIQGLLLFIISIIYMIIPIIAFVILGGASIITAIYRTGSSNRRNPCRRSRPWNHRIICFSNHLWTYHASGRD